MPAICRTRGVRILTHIQHNCRANTPVITGHWMNTSHCVLISGGILLMLGEHFPTKLKVILARNSGSYILRGVDFLTDMIVYCVRRIPVYLKPIWRKKSYISSMKRLRSAQVCWLFTILSGKWRSCMQQHDDRWIVDKTSENSHWSGIILFDVYTPQCLRLQSAWRYQLGYLTDKSTSKSYTIIAVRLNNVQTSHVDTTKKAPWHGRLVMPAMNS